MIRRSNVGVVKKAIDSIYSSSYVTPAINQYQYDKICMMCYQSDSLKVYAGGHGKQFNDNEDLTRAYLLDTFLMNGLFPNERLFGITADARIKEFYEKFNRSNPYNEWTVFKNAVHDPEEYDLYLSCPYNIVMHAQCFYWDHKDLFINAMKNGYIHPKEIAVIEERSIIHQGRRGGSNYDCLPLQYRVLYNVYGYNPMKAQQVYTDTEEGLLVVEKNRAEIYLQKYSVDLKKRALEREEGI